MSGKGLKKRKDSLPCRENRKKTQDNIAFKPKAQRSFSVPSKQRIKETATTKQLILPKHEQEKVTNDMDECSSSSTSTLPADIITSTLSNVEDGGWQTDDSESEADVSVEQLRAADLLSLDDVSLQPALQFRDSDFLPFHGPKISTPFSTSKVFHLTGDFPVIPDISSIKECDEEKDKTFHVKSISPEQRIEFPPIPEDDSQDESTVSINFAEVPTSEGFEVSDQSDEEISDAGCVEENSDDDNVQENFDVEQSFNEIEEAATHFRRLTNVNHYGSKNKNKIGNSSEDIDNDDSRNGSEDNLDIQTVTPKRKGKLYRGVGMNSNSRMGRLLKRGVQEENSFEDRNKTYSVNSFQNVQNTQNEELDNNQPETSTHQAERKNNKRVGVVHKVPQVVRNGSQFSTSKRRKQKVKRGSFFVDSYSNDNKDSFQIVQNIENEEFQPIKLDDNQPETAAHQSNRIFLKSGNKTQEEVQNRYQNLDQKKRKEKRRDQVINLAEDIFDFKSDNYLEGTQSIQIDDAGRKKLHKGVGIKRHRRGSRIKKNIKHLRGSKKSRSVEVSEHVHGNQNEASSKKLQWPLCCLLAPENRSTYMMKPVLRDDVPVDELTVILEGLKSKDSCLHHEMP